MGAEITVHALRTYPIKGCAAATVTTTDVLDTGLADDRRFMVVDDDGAFRTQRGTPRLALVRPLVDDGKLTLDGPGTESLTIEPADDGPRTEVTIFGGHHPAIDQGDDVATWLSAFLGRPSRLVGIAPEHHRPTDGEVPGRCGWADSGAVLVVGTASVDALGDRIAEKGEYPPRMSRFRPNIVLTGAPEHAEDDARRVEVGGVGLAFAKLAVRCAVVLVDQEAGVRDGPEPLRTLAEYRRDPDGGVVFGAKYTVLRPGRVSVGDRFDVTA